MGKLRFALFMGLVGLSIGSYGTLPIAAEKEVAEWNGTALSVTYGPHNGPSIKEFNEGKTRVQNVLDRLLQTGATPVRATLEVFIAPKKMSGGSCVWVDGKVYISVLATDGEMESALMDFITPSVAWEIYTFRPHLKASLTQLDEGIAKFKAALQAFQDAGLTLELPYTDIYIAKNRMSGGDFVVVDNAIWISTAIEADVLERSLIAYIKK